MKKLFILLFLTSFLFSSFAIADRVIFDHEFDCPADTYHPNSTNITFRYRGGLCSGSGEIWLDDPAYFHMNNPNLALDLNYNYSIWINATYENVGAKWFISFFNKSPSYSSVGTNFYFRPNGTNLELNVPDGSSYDTGLPLSSKTFQRFNYTINRNTRQVTLNLNGTDLTTLDYYGTGVHSGNEPYNFTIGSSFYENWGSIMNVSRIVITNLSAPPEAPPVDSTPPSLTTSSINNSNPLLNDYVEISQSATDDTDLNEGYLATNLTGTLVNESAVSLTGLSDNASKIIQITTGVMSYLWTIVDTAGNSIQSVLSTVTSYECVYSCTDYSLCEPSDTGGTLPCITVNETAECVFGGSLSTYDSTCDYCSPTETQVLGNCVANNRSITYTLDNNATCCQVTNESTDCTTTANTFAFCGYNDTYQVEDLDDITVDIVGTYLVEIVVLTSIIAIAGIAIWLGYKYPDIINIK